MKEEKDYRDISQKEAVTRINQEIDKGSSFLFYVKWTCPKCKRRVTCDEENKFYTSYIHTNDNCFYEYKEDDPEKLRVGLIVIYTVEKKKSDPNLN